MFQVPVLSSDLLVDEMTYLMFRFEELKESFYCPDKCAKAFPSCQKGYDQLSHGLLQTLKLQRSVVKAKEALEEIKTVARKIGTTEAKREKLWSDHLVRSLRKLSEFLSRSISTLAVVAEAENGTFEFGTDLAELKKESEKAGGLLADYAKCVDTLKMISSNESAAQVEEKDLMVRENVDKMTTIFEKLSVGHPNFSAGILSQLDSLHAEVVTKVGLMQDPML